MTETTLAPVIRAAWVQRTPSDAFAIFTDEIGAWWPLPTHGLFGSDAGGLGFRDGLLIEHATDGRETTWGEIPAWNEPVCWPTLLVFSSTGWPTRLPSIRISTRRLLRKG